MATIRKLRGRWQAQVRRRGVPPRAKSFDSKTEAERWARDLEAEADRSGWVADTRAAEKTTLKELLTRYRDEVTPGKRGSVSERARINSIVRCPIGHRTLAKLTSSDVATYRDERLKSVAPATIVRELNTISHAIEIATREWGLWLPRNPVRLVRRPPVPRGRTRRFKEGEEEALLTACDRGRTPLLKPLIVLAIETGMRRGELLDLRWEHVDLKRSVAHLPLTKNGDSRDVPLSRRAVKVLDEVHSDDPKRDRVFPMTGNAVRLAFEHLRVRAGMSDFHFHDLRHEAISRLFEKGLNIVEVSAISGHRELKMLKRYTHLRAADLVARLD
ncbi:site-specific integrase [Bradyrhizobium jicamae]|uniref:Site-specific integrase n=1 Tax=Bradyrhizobium jicamae TaxID=280332 RepID=A0ABS5FB48_9BRAD|nr:site-specific integrase [Bradyrhizobium jicamae]MBR0794006.1 site-specific integrase [Bradyrhizobium jicamae]